MTRKNDVYRFLLNDKMIYSENIGKTKQKLLKVQLVDWKPTVYCVLVPPQYFFSLYQKSTKTVSNLYQNSA
jgi:hypothetical protein